MRRARKLCAGALLGFGLGLMLAVVLPAAAGWRTLTVMSGSMSPAIDTGDVVVTRPVAPGSVVPGDVVTFRDPEGTDRLITHRVRSVRTVADAVEVVSKGDANSSTERWRVPTTGRVGEVVYRFPRIGYLLAPAAAPLGRMLLVALPALLLGLLMLTALWRSEPESEPEPEARPPLALPPGARPPLALPPGPRLLALPPGPEPARQW